MVRQKHTSHESHLVLGWRLNNDFHPGYWLSHKARSGKQANSDLITVPAKAMATHTLIVAQSGSGKSFLLGRIIEELMLRTLARCIVFDPNADFRFVGTIREKEAWKNAKYDAQLGRGLLLDEESRVEFEKFWKPITKIIRTTASETAGAKKEPLQVWWPSVSFDFIAEDIDAIMRASLYHCHSFTKAIGYLIQMCIKAGQKVNGIIDEVEDLYLELRHSERQRQILDERFKASDIANANYENKKVNIFGALTTLHNHRTLFIENIHRLIDNALSAFQYVDDFAMPFYLGKARAYEAEGMLSTSPSESFPKTSKARLEIIDIASLPTRSSRLLAAHSVLGTEWDDAYLRWANAIKNIEFEDRRVPTFIVVDEAHNLIPAMPRDRLSTTILEQFRTIVAEGRKFGLFLILITQKPEKLDPFIVSECENKAIMRMGSYSMLMKDHLNIDLKDIDLTILRRCLEYGIGRALLTGRWTQQKSKLLYCAARRTKEGGRNLQPAYWARAPQYKKQLG